MSTHSLRCSTCHRECLYDRCAPFGHGQEATYCVAWRCPEGHGLSLDVCPVGPLVPFWGLCLNCGAQYPSDAANAQCGECGLTRRACLAALGLANTAVDDPISAARAAFGQGLIRQGVAILNQALEEGKELLEAWLLKTRLLNAVGFNRAAAMMLDGAAVRFSSAADRILLLEEQSFLWAECECGAQALSSAEAAAELGSNSVRTHYLRGRALGLLGRLEDARKEMNYVLSIDPNNGDAKRGIKLIDAACRPKERKRWWQLWKQ